MMIAHRALLLFLIVSMLSCSDRSANSPRAAWQLVPFTKVDSVNPVLRPDSSSVFFDPILNSEVQWEAKDVFNPAAIVRHDTLFLLYRAEDKIGKYAGTSRIGLAWSIDGFHFHKQPTPVLYPKNDEQKKWEWEGGCED